MDNIRLVHFNSQHKIVLIFLLFILITLSTFAYAIQPSEQYSKIYLSPFYKSDMIQNIWYNYSVNIASPDGMSNIKSAIVTLDAWINPTRTFSAKINNIYCMNNYTISTTYASAGRSVVTFDCSNAVKMNSINNVSFIVTGGNIGSSTAFIELTYENNPKGELTLHGTEYTFGQTSKVWLQLLNSSGDYINNGVCYTDIYNPDSTDLIERATMTNDLHDGIYYYDIVLPEVEGVYPAIALCYYTAGRTYNYATSITMINGSISAGDITRTYILDTNYLTTDETPLALGNPRMYWSEMNFTNGSICSNISSLLLTGITIDWTGRWNSNPTGDTMTISVYNYSSASWISLPNTITGVGTGVKSVSNSISLNNITSAGLVNSSGSNLRLKFQDTNITDTSTNGFDYDYVYVSCDQLSSPEWQETKGSSELHLSAPINLSMLNYTSRFDTIDSTLSLLNNTIIAQFNQLLINMTQYYNNIINYIISIPYNVWVYTTRNLTYYPAQMNQTDLTNYTRITDDIWNYTGRYTHGVILT